MITIAVCQWYKASIGPRLKPKIRNVYKMWAGFADNELIPHLHRMVSTSTILAPLQFSIELNQQTY